MCSEETFLKQSMIAYFVTNCTNNYRFACINTDSVHTNVPHRPCLEFVTLSCTILYFIPH